MKALIKGLIFSVAVAMPLTTDSQAGAAAPPPPGPVDQYGDPLPRGAVARLGTLRFVHLGGLASVAISPDGKVVASGVTKGEDVYLGEKILHEKDGFSVGEGDRRTLATIRLWDAAGGTVVREIVTPDAPVSCMRFGPGGSLFAGCGRFLCAWDVTTGKKLWQKEGVPGGRFHYGIRAERLFLMKDRLVSFHGGTLMCPVSKDGGTHFYYHPQVLIRVWDRDTGRSIATPASLQSTVDAESHVATLFQDAAASPDGRFVAVLASRADPVPRGDDGRPPHGDRWKYSGRRSIIIDLATGKACHTIPLGKDLEDTRDSWPFNKVVSDGLAFSADGDILAMSVGGEITTVSTATGQKRLLAKDLPGGMRLAFVGPRQLAAELAERKVRAWDVATGKRIGSDSTHAHAFVATQNGRIAVATHGNTVRVTDLGSGKVVRPFEGHRGTPLVRFAWDSRDVLLTRDGEGACLWDTRLWKSKGTLALPKDLSDSRSFFGDSIDEGVSWEKGLFVHGREKRVEIRDLETGRLVRPLATEKGYAPVFSASGNRVVVQTEDAYRFFDVGTGKAISRLPRSNVVWLRPNEPELSPRGTYFAKNDKGDRVELYEVHSGKLLRTLAPRPTLSQGTSILRFHFSPDEETLFGETHQLAESKGGFTDEKVAVTLWDVKSGDILQEIVVNPHAHSFWRQTLSEPVVGAMALSQDRRLVALARTGGKDIEVWETASGMRRGVLTGHIGPVVSLSFSRDGKRLASGSEDTTVLVWDLHRPLRVTSLPGRLGEMGLAAHWKTLSLPDAKAADLAIWQMASAPEDAVRFLKHRLRPVVEPKKGAVEGLLSDLDSDSFETRSAAAAAIERLGEIALRDLQKAARQKNSPEKRRRLRSLLLAAEMEARPFGAAEKLRQWRALEILEKAATPEATALLKDMASGALDARLTQEARAALGRLVSRAK